MTVLISFNYSFCEQLWLVIIFLKEEIDARVYLFSLLSKVFLLGREELPKPISMALSFSLCLCQVKNGIWL